MIAVDASAVVAILLDEPDAEDLSRRILLAGGGLISPVNHWEVLVRMRSAKGAPGIPEAEAVMARLGVSIASIDGEQARAAAEAAARFGRGTPARLNLGDCFAYALAKREGDGLLYKGDHFPRTDIPSAL